MIPINARHMEAWQIDEPTLYQVAMSNLSQRKTEYMIGGEGEMQLSDCLFGKTACCASIRCDALRFTVRSLR